MKRTPFHHRFQLTLGQRPRQAPVPAAGSTSAVLSGSRCLRTGLAAQGHPNHLLPRGVRVQAWIRGEIRSHQGVCVLCTCFLPNAKAFALQTRHSGKLCGYEQDKSHSALYWAEILLGSWLIRIIIPTVSCSLSGQGAPSPSKSTTDPCSKPAGGKAKPAHTDLHCAMCQCCATSPAWHHHSFAPQSSL